MVQSLPMDVLLYSEINVLSLTVILIIGFSAIRTSESVTHRAALFAASAFSAAAANVFDFFWNIGITNYWTISVDVRQTVNLCYFLSLGLASWLWFLYTEAEFMRSRLPGRVIALTGIPLGVLVVLLVISRYTGCVYYIDEAGEYHRGALYYTQHVLSYGYMLLASLRCTVRSVSKENYARRDELLAMAVFAVPPVICTIAQIFLQNLPILSAGIMISYLLVFIQSLESRVSKDDLTEIAGRRELLRALASEIHELGEEENLYFMFMDIDRFKRTNDEFGHVEGDRALRTLASVLKSVSNETNGFCARYGGDEFAFFVKCGEEREAHLIRQVIEEMALKKSSEDGLKCPLQVSVGFAKYRPDMDGLQGLIAEADTAMYKEKTRRKAQR